MKRILKIIWAGWKKFAHALGVFNTKVLLTISYFLVIGPAALTMRLLRRDLLDRKFAAKDAMWKTKETPVPDLEQAKRQF